MSKANILVTVEYAPTKPVIATVDDVLSHCIAGDKLDRFLNVEAADTPVHLDHLRDEGLRRRRRRVMAISTTPRISRTSTPSDVCLKMETYKCSWDTAWLIPVASYMIIIVGLQYYEGKEHQYVGYLVVNILQNMGREMMRRRTTDASSCQRIRKDFYNLAESLPT